MRNQIVPFLCALVAVAVAAGAYAQSEDRQFTREELRAKRDRNLFLLNIPGVYGVAVLRSGVVRVYIDQKEVVVLENSNVLRFNINEQKELTVSAKDALQLWRISEIKAFAAVPVGSSTSNNGGCFTGTVGLTARQGQQVGYITANHVAAAEQNRLCPNTGNARVQVSPATGETAKCAGGPKIGRLVVPPPPIVFTMMANGPTNTKDAAFVVKRGDGVDPTPLCPISWDGTLAHDLPPGTLVQQCGARSAWKKDGQIAEVLFNTFWIRYNCGFRALFEGQIVVDGAGFSAPGDSGAPLFTMDGKVVGMIFAGGQDITLANPIDDVLTGLNATLCPPGAACP